MSEEKHNRILKAKEYFISFDLSCHYLRMSHDSSIDIIERAQYYERYLTMEKYMKPLRHIVGVNGGQIIDMPLYKEMRNACELQRHC